MKKPRFILVHNDDNDDFYVPVDKYMEWYTHYSSVHDDLLPEYAKRIIGKFTFTDPKVG